MAQYTATSFAAAGTIVSSPNSGLNQELRNIAAAHNLHAAADIATAASVSRAALVCDKSYFTLTLKNQLAISGPSTSATIQAYCVVPFTCEVVSGFVTTLLPAAAGDQIISIKKEGDPDVAVFVAKATPGVYGSYLLTGPLVTDLVAGDVLTMRVSFATTANTSALNYCTILAKAVHD